ncbi:hypothetical protein AVEN_103021-1 [Araneus ventricosus]|uniref:Uncharacterized protein n=1 Tax=Araneus ventricosus TaxID=182803 RepID=A0A4Y2B830_ARAVE|nr:hypothetical protein AVEN_103021-1 [Araneus ventricosus]
MASIGYASGQSILPIINLRNQRPITSYLGTSRTPPGRCWSSKATASEKNRGSQPTTPGGTRRTSWGTRRNSWGYTKDQLVYVKDQLGYAKDQLWYAKDQLWCANDQLGYAKDQLGYAKDQLGYANSKSVMADTRKHKGLKMLLNFGSPSSCEQ